MDYTLKEIDHGQKFKANISGYFVEGKISKNKFGSIYFCTNNDKLDGDYTPDKFGYKYSWALDEEVNSLKVLIKNKYVQVKANQYTIFKHKFKINKDVFTFGCGAVKLNRKEIQDYVKGYKLVEKYPGFTKVKAALFENEIPENKRNFEKIKNLLILR